MYRQENMYLVSGDGLSDYGLYASTETISYTKINDNNYVYSLFLRLQQHVSCDHPQPEQKLIAERILFTSWIHPHNTPKKLPISATTSPF